MPMIETQNDRVVLRQGARELTPEELKTIIGAAHHTATKCTFDPITQHTDGDTGEC